MSFLWTKILAVLFFITPLNIFLEEKYRFFINSFTSFFPKTLINRISWFVPKFKNKLDFKYLHDFGSIEIVLNLIFSFIRYLMEVINFNPWIEYFIREEAVKKFSRICEILICISREPDNSKDFEIFLSFCILDGVSYSLGYLLGSPQMFFAYLIRETFKILEEKSFKALDLSIALIVNFLLHYTGQVKIKMNIPGKEEIHDNVFGTNFRYLKFIPFRAAIPSIWNFSRISSILNLDNPFSPTTFNLLTMFFICYFQIINEELFVNRLNLILKQNGGSIDSKRPGLESQIFLKRKSMFWGIANLGVGFCLFQFKRVRPNLHRLMMLFNFLIETPNYLWAPVWLFKRNWFGMGTKTISSEDIKRFYNSVTIANKI